MEKEMTGEMIDGLPDGSFNITVTLYLQCDALPLNSASFIECCSTVDLLGELLLVSIRIL